MVASLAFAERQMKNSSSVGPGPLKGMTLTSTNVR